MMKYKVAATEALLRKMSSRQIMHLLNEWSVRYFMRRNMIRLQGMFLIIGLPDELDQEDIGRKIEIGEYLS